MTNKKQQIDATFGEWLGEDTDEMPRDQLVQSLDALYKTGPSKEESVKVLAQLSSEMEKVMPSEIHYDSIEDPKLGELWLAVEGNELIAISYEENEEGFLQYLEKLVDGRFRPSSSAVKWAQDDVSAYLKNEIDIFDLAVNLNSMTVFQRKVLNETQKIPRGQIKTYGEIAKLIGHPKAVRAVGQALRRNPLPIVVPCHRVVASNGLGGYSGKMGDARKIHLLKLEGVVFA